MNDNQKKYLNDWLKENQFIGEKESEWTPPTVVHTSDIAPLFERLLLIN